jgi:hypothetical protein
MENLSGKFGGEELLFAELCAITCGTREAYGDRVKKSGNKPTCPRVLWEKERAHVDEPNPRGL